MLTGTVRCLLLLLFFNLLAFNNLNAQQFKNEQDLRKEADHLFDDDEFTKAYVLYTQLVSLYPKDPDLNYKLGVCMLYSEPDKKKCFSYLKFAATHPKEAPKDAKFYYAKAFHINYMFDEALTYYKEYKNIGSAAQQKRLQVDKEIAACVNGKRLLATMSELIILNKKQLNEADYFRSYDLSSIGGKLLVKPDMFRTSYDKKKKEKSVIYIPKSGDKIYFSSLGDKGETGRDIYYSVKISPEKFSKPVKLPTINTEFDEDYPFLHPDGKTLYFSSKGFNSMGGYDIFKSVYNEETNTWSEPVNMEFPINSPDDDYLFVTDSSEKFAYFSTGRQSPPGKIDVLKVKTERIPMTVAYIKGTVLKENAAQSLHAKITVKNMENGQVVGVFQAKDNGDYSMEVPNGGKLLFTVETPGIPVQSDKVILPMASSFSPFKQSISYDNKVLKIINYFDSPPDDNSYLQYLELIEKKAKLDVNENEIKNAIATQPLATADKQPKAVNTNNPSVNPDKNENKKEEVDKAVNATTTATNSAKPNYNNDQLIQIAKEDAKEAQNEANKMNQDAADANELATQKKTDADKFSKQAEEAIAYANSLTDPIKKETATEEAAKIKNDADEAGKVAATLLTFAKALEHDAINKQKEADLNAQYVKELENISKNKNNKDALTKLTDLQKKIEAIANQKKESEDLYTSIKNEYEKNQSEIQDAEKKSTALRNEISEINKEITINETEISNTKDKSLKKTLTAQVNELKTDLEKKKTELEVTEKNVTAVKEKAAPSETGMYLINQVKTTDSKTAIAAVITNTSVASSLPAKTNSITANNAAANNTVAATTINAESLAVKYEEKLIPINENTGKEHLQNNNIILSDYNKEITNLIVKENNQLKTAKTENEKTALRNDINLLQKQKEANVKLIAANTTKIKEQETPVAVITKTETSNPVSVNTETNAAITATSSIVQFDGKDDLNKLNSLKTTINSSDNSAFSYNGYQEEAALSLKKEAENKLLIATNSKKSLDSAITKAEENIKANEGKPSGTALKDQLNNEGDALSAKAKETRNLANSKKSEEKEKLLAEAKQLENDANKKYLEASELNKKLNKNNYDINNQNITELVNQAMYLNKNTPENTANLNEGQKLQAEASNYLKQATAMREEANNLASDAAKLGTISNAEEKEAEAITKQQKAIEILLKSNPGYTVKKSEFAENPNAAALLTVKQKFNQLNKQKLDAFLTLSKANQNEFKARNTRLGQNAAIKNNSNKEAISLKKQAESVNAKAITLISKALTEQDANTKQNLILEANKKEVEALDLLVKAGEQLQPVAIAGNEKPVKEQQTTTNEIKNEVVKENKPVKENITEINNNESQPVLSNTTTITKNQEKDPSKNIVENNQEPVKSTTVTVKTPVTKTQEKETVATINTQTNTIQDNKPDSIKNNPKVKTNQQTLVSTKSTSINPEYKLVKDTSVKSLISYIDTHPVSYKNAEATTIKSNSINQLIALSEAQTSIEEEIKKLPGNEIGTDEVITGINQLNTEADAYETQAATKRKEAVEKTGDEKDLLIKEITELENKSLLNRTKASDQQKELNTAQYNYNNEAITNYMDKAIIANAPELSKAQELITQINAAKKQSGDLREEANNITNPSAKLGAYSNAEEKETDVIKKQKELIGLLKKYDEAYSQKPLVIKSGPETITNPELKQKYETILSKQNSELENITKANVMEYETIHEQLPVILSEKQKQNKSDAEKLISSSKVLTDKANQTGDLKLKKDLLKQATRQGQEAIMAINKVYEKDLIAKNNKPVKEKPVKEVKEKPVKEKPIKEITEPVVVTKKESAVNENNVSGNNQLTLNVKGLEIKTGNAYSSGNPIPLDGKIPDGLIFRVQVGAFKLPIPNSTFKGLTPVNAQTTPNGFIRYTVGNFEKFEEATGVKNDLRNLGYSDAFVVVFYNGQRITVNEAINIAQKEGKEVIASNNTSAGIPVSANIPKNIAPAVPKNEQVVVTRELEKMNGLLFTVQIGVYSREITRSQLWKLEPIYTEKLPTGLYRYTAGIYNDGERVITDKKKVVDLGIKDAFVSAYYNGKRVPFTEGQKIKAENQNLKMEPENPIVFPSENTGGIAPSPNNTTPESAPVVQPFKNNVSSAPAPTAENGIKVGDDGVSFKVQIGAYRNQVPTEIASKFLNIKTWPIENHFVNGLFIYSVGNFTEAKFAKQLRDEVMALGVTDAFISVYQNGKKLYGQEASNYLNR